MLVMKKFILLILMILIFPLTYAWQWDDLWQTKDQQAIKMLSQGKSKSAAKTFENKQWKGIANYRSGDYQAASDLFSQNKSARELYNKGNALAHLSQYEKAIKAYDSSLKMDPKDKDAIYNRDLLKKLLKQSKNKKSDSQKNKKKNKKDQNKKKQQAKNNKPSKSKKDKNSKQAGNYQKQQKPKSKNNEKKQAQSKQQKNKAGQNQQAKQQARPTEKQQSQKQWLRRIPDNPGGFLRQKFLRDHIRRQQQG